VNNFHWIKFWIETLYDYKLGLLPDNLWRRFFELCLLAGELGQDGKLPPIEEMCYKLRVDKQTIESELDQLDRQGLIEHRAEDVLGGYWFIINYAKRQTKIEGKDRVKAFRERQKKQDYYEVRNEGVTTCYTEEEEEGEEEVDEEEEEEYVATFAEIADTWAKIRGGTINGYDGQVLGGYIEDWREIINERPAKHPDKKYTPEWVVLQAVKITGKSADNPTLNYTEAVLNNWYRKGVKLDTRKRQDITVGNKPIPDGV
jgi:DNA-binding transcriptional regulator YhcF (GntR family)